MYEWIKEKDIISFTDWMRKEEKSTGTIEKYVRDVRTFRSFLEEKKRLPVLEKKESAERVTREDMAAWKEFLVQSGYAVATINSMLTAVNGFCRFMGWEECRVRPLKRQKRIFSDEKKELTKEEYLLLLKTAEKKGNRRLYFILQTIAATGIRISELPYITVESLQTGRSEVSCKGKLRVILITKKLRRCLRDYCRERGIFQGSIFITKSGQPVNRSNVWKEMKRLCEVAGVGAEKVFPHNLRHLFARTFYHMEKDIAKLADLLGHASIETTRIYLIESGREHERQVARLGLVI